jgi:hypothetical protein
MRRPYGVHKAIMDLADMSENIIGKDVEFMTDKEIEDALDRAQAGLMTG